MKMNFEFRALINPYEYFTIRLRWQGTCTRMENLSKQALLKTFYSSGQCRNYVLRHQSEYITYRFRKFKKMLQKRKN